MQHFHLYSFFVNFFAGPHKEKAILGLEVKVRVRGNRILNGNQLSCPHKDSKVCVCVCVYPSLDLGHDRET